MDRCGSKSMHVKHLIGLIISLVLLIQSSANFAQTPSAAQIEKFKQLPASQQQALAKQYGVDLGALSNSNYPQPNINKQSINNNRKPISDIDTELQTEAIEIDPLLELDEQEPEP
ncbi:MAG: hypothetical protein QMC22_04285, partial [Pseudomonadales bacterium]